MCDLVLAWYDEFMLGKQVALNMAVACQTPDKHWNNLGVSQLLAYQRLGQAIPAHENKGVGDPCLETSADASCNVKAGAVRERCANSGLNSFRTPP